jgi:hypothetical protein
VYTVIHYACFSFLHFLEEYSEQDEKNDNKQIELVLTDTNGDPDSVDLIAHSQHRLRTLFRRYGASQEWKSSFSKLVSKGDEGET